MGLWRGKKGSNVFYYNRNSNNAQKQAVRERVYEVANPQSDAQVAQRVKLLPAQRIAQQLNAVLKRSWQGVEYGGKGLQEFYKRALRMKAGYPFVDKEEDRAIPGEYQISKGTIGQVTMSLEDLDAQVSNLICDPADVNTTWGQNCESLIAYNDIKQGDQLTIVACKIPDSTDYANINYEWVVFSVIVDVNDTELFRDKGSRGVKLGSPLVEGAEHLGVIAENLAASAIIVSRLASNGQSYERSTATLFVNPNVLEYWTSSSRRSAARRSYQKQAGGQSTNWPVDPEEGGTAAGTISGTYTLSGLTGDYAAANGKTCWVRYQEDTGALAAVYITGWLGEPSDVLVDGSTNAAMEVTVSMQDVPVRISQIATQVPALASLRQITWEGVPVD